MRITVHLIAFLVGIAAFNYYDTRAIAEQCANRDPNVLSRTISVGGFQQQPDGSWSTTGTINCDDHLAMFWMRITGW